LRFVERVEAAERANNSLLCVGLDPDPEKMPRQYLDQESGLFDFCKEVVDATSDLVLAYKPQAAFFNAAGNEAQLQQLISYIHETTDIPVILDSKRGDILNTSKMYAKEAFEYYDADAVTLNPYMGKDSIDPFLEHHDKGLFLLCRTSNPGSGDIQNLEMADGRRLFEHIAEKALSWNDNGNICLVVGATQPEELTLVRNAVGDMTLLIPGVGSQGGDPEALIRAARGGGVIVSSSRAINYAGSGPDYRDDVRQMAMQTRDTLNDHLYRIANDLRA
jgi:orotidine-5'-phosphate decarboxylase